MGVTRMRTLPIYPTPPRLAVEDVKPEVSTVNYCTADCALREVADGTICLQPLRWAPKDTQPNNAVLILLDAPTKNDARSGRIFTSSEAKFVHQQVSKRWDGTLYLDAAVRCAPGSRDVTAKHVAACRPYTAQIIADSKPEMILCFGSDAIASVVGQKYDAGDTRRGYALLSDGTPVFFFPNCFAAFRNRFRRDWLLEDLDWVFALARNGILHRRVVEPPPLKGEVMFVETPEDAKVAVAACYAAGGVTLDLETLGGPHNRGSKILDLALTPYGASVGYLLTTLQIAHPTVFDIIRQALEDPDLPKCGHHIKYDAGYLQARKGVRVRGVQADTRMYRRLTASHTSTALDGLQPIIGMAGGKAEAGAYAKAGAAELKRLTKNPKLHSQLFNQLNISEISEMVARAKAGEDLLRFAYVAIPKDKRAVYCVKDTISTDRLRVHLESDMAALPGVTETWNESVLGLNEAITQMEVTGILVSRQAIEHLQSVMTGKLRAIRERLDRYGTDFSPQSGDQVGELLFGKLGLRVKGVPSPARTPTGKYQVTEDVLGALNHDAAKDILAWKHAAHFKSQYADGMIKFIQDDGRIHPAINLDGTVSGRPSCTTPNLMNIPRAKGDGKFCKDIFIAPPGFKLLEMDFSQVEVRVAAVLSGDKTLIQLFRSGADVHLGTAKLIAHYFGFKPEEITKDHPLRSRAKGVVFGALYGLQAAGLAADLGCTKVEAQKVIDAVMGCYPDLKRHIDTTIHECAKTGYVRTWWNNHPGRLRYVPEIGDMDQSMQSGAQRSAYNTVIQGTAAEFTNASLGAIQMWLDENPHIHARLILTVYDSIMLEVQADQLQEVARQCKTIMEGWPSQGVPFAAEAKAGQSWGTLEDLHVE